MIDREQMLAAYEQAWTQQDESAIRAELERCWTPDSTYVSPLTDVVQGIDGLTGLILDFPVMFPDAQVRPTGPPDVHHDVAYFPWQLTSTRRIRTMGRDYGRSLDGVDVVEFAEDGRIRRIMAFFGIDHRTLRRTMANSPGHRDDGIGWEHDGAGTLDQQEAAGAVVDLADPEPLLR